MKNYLRKGFTILKTSGFKGLEEKIKDKFGKSGMSYQEWYLKNEISARELEEQRNYNFNYNPLISVIVPTYNTPLNFLEEMIASLQKQSYTNWELCIGDGSQGNLELEQYLKQAATSDARIKYKILDRNMGIAGNTNGALELATGDYVALLDHDDFLAPQALFRVVELLQGTDKIDVFYTDEDFVSGDGKTHIFPILKPDYSEELLCSHNYITHFFVAKRVLFLEAGGFCSELDGSQDYDIIFKCVERANFVKHIPEVLYHWRMHAASVAGDPDSKTYAYTAGKRAIENHMMRSNIEADVEYIEGLHGMYHSVYKVKNAPLVSIIICQKHNDIDIIENIKQLINVNNYENIEIVLVSNQSYEDIFLKNNNVKCIKYDNQFNYARLNNIAAKQSKGDYLLFLNDSLMPTKGQEIEEMLGICQKEEVVGVGGKVLYYDDTVRHAGIVLGTRQPIEYAFSGIDNMDDGYLQRPRINCNYSAVSGLCMLVKKEVFIENNGFDEKIDDGISDVEFCYRIKGEEKRIVYVASAQWKMCMDRKKAYKIKKNVSAESKSFLKAISNMNDPYYNKNFSKKTKTFSVLFK